MGGGGGGGSSFNADYHHAVVSEVHLYLFLDLIFNIFISSCSAVVLKTVIVGEH